VKGSTKREWAFPEAMTFGDLRDLVMQGDLIDAESKVTVRVKLGGQVKSLAVESPGD
jgi:hypothetical protein